MPSSSVLVATITQSRASANACLGPPPLVDAERAVGDERRRPRGPAAPPPAPRPGPAVAEDQPLLAGVQAAR